MSLGQWLNAIGILCEMFAVFLIFNRFPKEEEYMEDEVQRRMLGAVGLTTKIPSYDEKKWELRLVQGSVAAGLIFELLATFY